MCMYVYICIHHITLHIISLSLSLSLSYHFIIHVHINYCERRGLGVWESRKFSQQEDMFRFLRELGEIPRYVKEGNKG